MRKFGSCFMSVNLTPFCVSNVIAFARAAAREADQVTGRARADALSVEAACLQVREREREKRECESARERESGRERGVGCMEHT